jgi:hypothetical protein
MDFLNFAVAHPEVAFVATVAMIWAMSALLKGLADIAKAWRSR